ncbi:hypothetical protein FE810_09365 [Thalassotalea litorea]|uniref:Uncharacterized protein n=1 Tax=Thalassotalea litorea TaxID=2020715 RepID=A0A5R9IHY4_9GAMM|nr:hypothetical protein [Thalassotalea litorea]TLU65125.1 hypothetical protein FE810_09365 [Thalassotalea litorea]
MKKINVFVGSLFTAIAFSAVAEETYELEYAEEAPASYIEQVLDTCKIYAQEDDVSAEEMMSYLLACVNDDLEMNDYQTLSTLPKE